jgi:hypothetical protein
MSNVTTTRINLWSGPRNISTALMYSFAQRNDTKVYDEPLYAHYLSNTNANEYHPGADEVLAEMENDGNKVVDMMLGNHDKPVVFFKQMTHHLVNIDQSFMKEMVNIILTRDPVEMLPSYAKEVPNPKMRDVGYRQHHQLLEYLTTIGHTPVVLTSENVLKDPSGTLQKLCRKIGIRFDDNMLHWKKGPRPEDGPWAKYWYYNVHQSTGFMPYKPPKKPFPAELEPLLAECVPYYERLAHLSI